MTNSITKLSKKISQEMLDFISDDDFPAYSPDQVKICMTLLANFVTSIKTQSDNIEFALTQVKELVLALNKLNDQCENCLIETEQREDICEFIDLVLTESGYQFDGDVTEQWREW